MTERELIDAIQADKAAMREKLKRLLAINKDADRAAATNAVFLTMAELDVWHGKATDRLLINYPEFAAEVITRGPGRG
jgi:hypothetical protein